MPENQQDILTQTLLKLEHELTSFGSIQKTLKESHDTLIHSEEEWSRLTNEQKKASIDLAISAKSAIDATSVVTSQTKGLADALIKLAKGIEAVNFPNRLDKIDMAVSTQANNMASLQGATERGLRELHVDNEKNATKLSDGFEAASKKNKVNTVLLVINTLVLIGLAVLFYLKGYVPLG